MFIRSIFFLLFLIITSCSSTSDKKTDELVKETSHKWKYQKDNIPVFTSKVVTYKVFGIDEKLGISKKKVDIAMFLASKEYNKYSDTRIIKTLSGHYDIAIYSQPKDGNVLAEAYSSDYSNGPCIELDNSKRFWDREKINRVILHELGHVMGMPHLIKKYNIMFFILGDVNKLSKYDIALYRYLYSDDNTVKFKFFRQPDGSIKADY